MVVLWVEKVNERKDKFGRREEYKFGQVGVELCVEFLDRDIKLVVSNIDLELGGKFGMKN